MRGTILYTHMLSVLRGEHAEHMRAERIIATSRHES